MKLDADRSRLAVYTLAEGFLSALAHDLELVATGLTGDATESSAELHVPVASIQVTGVMKRGRLDRGVLSPGDRETIERQVREEVLPGPEVVVRGALGETGGERATIEIAAPKGGARFVCDVSITDEEGGSGEESGKRVRGETEVSLAAIGAPPVKGPMGAFRVKDRVRVAFDLVFR